MSWKVVGGSILILLVIVGATAGASVLSRGNVWDRIAGPYSFNIARWELDNLFGKWLFKAEDLLNPRELSEQERVQLVRNHLQLRQDINNLEGAIQRAKAEGADTNTDIASWEAELAVLEAELDQDARLVEEIIEGQLSTVLADEGLSATLNLVGKVDLLFPPVDFQFEDRPNVLIVSRRDAIESVDTTLLRSDLTYEDIVAMEHEVAGQGFSGLVERTGGVATYPSIVPPMSSLQNLLSLVAHEWLHHYLYFRPLGQNYWASSNMTTVNETVADIAGNEIGSLAYHRFYGDGSLSNLDSPPQTKTEFDFGAEMRQIRIAVDDLLSQGKIEEAEAYMEVKRLYLAENGYYIRKLNQAYFAFHGSYADSPTSVSPIGPILRGLRHQSPSVGDFVMTLSQVSTYDELLEIASQNDGT